MRNVKIGKKLLLGFGLLLLFVGVAVAFGYSYINKVTQESDFLASEIVPVMDTNLQLERAVYVLFSSIDTYRMTEADSAAKIVQENFDKVEALLRNAQNSLSENSSRTNLDNVVVNEVLPAFEALRNMVQGKMKVISHKKEVLDASMHTGDQLQKNLKEDILPYDYRKIEEEKADRGEDPKKFDRRIEHVRVYEDLLHDVTDMRRQLFVAFSHQNLDEVKSVLNLANTVQQKLANLDMTIDSETPERAEIYQSSKSLGETYVKQIEEQVNLYVKVQELHAATTPLKQNLSDLTTKVTLEAQKNTNDIAQSAVKSLKVSMNILLYSTIVAGIIGIAIALFISRMITRPLATIVALAQRSQSGDLTIQREDFHYEGKDELGMLVQALSSMIQQQEATIKQVVLVTDRVTQGSERLASIIKETDASVHEIKASVEEVATLSENNSEALQRCNSSVEEMSTGADTTANAATQSATFISQITEASNNAVKTVNSVIKEMGVVNSKSQESETKIEHLVQAIEQISGFVSVITNIADQTNLLALNAAIEAARAGEAGRGFAVVAEEVRKLAEESGNAAQNVNKLIDTLQNNAKAVITVTTESGDILRSTMGQADKAQTELSAAVTNLQNANESIQNIAAVAEEQSASSREIASTLDNATQSTISVVHNLENIRRATEGSVHASNNTAVQAQEMLEEVVVLRDVLSHFKIHGNPAPVQALPK